MTQRLDQQAHRLAALSRTLSSLDPRRPKPGFARIEDETGRMLASASSLEAGQAIRIVFGDGARDATVGGDIPAPAKAATRAKPKPKPAGPDQGDLF